jgi:hypothetical protein
MGILASLFLPIRHCCGILQGASDVGPVPNMGVTVEVKKEQGDISRDSSIESADYTCCKSQLESVGLPQRT